jgi:hypothetical protein
MAPDTMTVHFRSTRSSETEPTTGYTTTTDVTGTHGSVTLYYSSSNSGSVPERVTERVWIEEGYENELYRQQKLAARYRIELWLAERRRAAIRAERERRVPEARPPKARTEWGMVHRERCVHRCGLN